MESALNQQGAYFSAGTPENSVDTTPYAPGLLGKEVLLNIGTTAAPLYRKYKYVKAGGTIAANAVVEWQNLAGIGSTVIVGTSTKNPLLTCGASAYTGSVTSGQYFWISVLEPGNTAVVALGAASSQTYLSNQTISLQLSNGSVSSFVSAALANTTDALTMNRPVAINLNTVVSSSASSLSNTSISIMWIGR